MIASTVAWGNEIRPNADKPKVILWATVNAVIVFIATIRFETKYLKRSCRLFCYN